MSKLITLFTYMMTVTLMCYTTLKDLCVRGNLENQKNNTALIVFERRLLKNKQQREVRPITFLD